MPNIRPKCPSNYLSAICKNISFKRSMTSFPDLEFFFRFLANFQIKFHAVRFSAFECRVQNDLGNFHFEIHPGILDAFTMSYEIRSKIVRITWWIFINFGWKKHLVNWDEQLCYVVKLKEMNKHGYTFIWPNLKIERVISLMKIQILPIFSIIFIRSGISIPIQSKFRYSKFKKKIIFEITLPL